MNWRKTLEDLLYGALIGLLFCVGILLLTVVVVVLIVGMPPA